MNKFTYIYYIATSKPLNYFLLLDDTFLSYFYTCGLRETLVGTCTWPISMVTALVSDNPQPNAG